MAKKTNKKATKKATKKQAIKKLKPIEGEVVDPQAVENEKEPIDNWKLLTKNLHKILTKKQILFCHYYISTQEFFCNGTQSYAKAYWVDLKVESKKYKACQVNASKLLSNTIICRYINKLLKDIIPDEWIDKLLTKHAIQNYDPKLSMEAIKELNKLRGRIIEKVKDVTFENPLEDFNSQVKIRWKKKK